MIESLSTIASGVTPKTTNTQQLQQLAVAQYDLATMTPEEIAKLRDACDGIEEIFVKMLTTQLRRSIQRQPLSSASQQQGFDIFEELLYNEYGRLLTRSGSLGISDMLFRQKTTPTVPPSALARAYTQP